MAVSMPKHTVVHREMKGPLFCELFTGLYKLFVLLTFMSSDLMTLKKGKFTFLRTPKCCWIFLLS